MEFSVALDEVVQEAGLTALKPNNVKQLRGLFQEKTFLWRYQQAMGNPLFMPCCQACLTNFWVSL